MKIATVLSRLSGIARGIVCWGLRHRLRIGAAVGGIAVLVGIAAGVIVIVEFGWKSRGSPSTEVQDVTAMLSVVNETTSEVRVSPWFQYQLVEFYTVRVVEGPKVSSRPRLLGSEERLDTEIALNPGDHVELLLDIRVDGWASALLDRGSAELVVSAYLSNGEPIVNSLPFQRDTLRDFYLELSVGDEP